MKSLLSLLLLASLATPASAQVFVRPGNATMPVNGTAAQKERLEREIAFLIGDMKRTCELSDAQVRKLQLAGKGAVASAMEKFEEQQKKMRVMMQQLGGPFAVPEPAGQDEDEEEEKEDADVEEAGNEDGENEIRVAGGLAQALNLTTLGTPGQTNTSPTKEPRWAKAVQSVVSKEQREKYAETVKQRAAFIRKSAVSVFIAKVDQKLLLSKDQREKLTTLVDEGFGKEFAARVSQNQSGMLWVQNAAGGKPPIAHDKLKKFFSSQQLSEWKASFEHELNRLKPNRGGGAFGNVIINGVGGGAIQIEQVIEEDNDDQ